MLGIEWLLAYVLLGAFVGFMAGLLGVSGGGILVPLLTLIFIQQGANPDEVVHLALGTAMAAMVITSYSSLRAHNARGAVLWKIVSGMAPGIIVGAFLATRVASYVSSVWIAIFFSLFMLLVFVQMLSGWSPKSRSESTGYGGPMLAGAGIGFVSALAAVGGGFLTIAYLTYKSADIKKAIGTSAAIGLPIAISGSLGYMINGWSRTPPDAYAIGFVSVPVFLLIATSSLLAAPYGVRLSHHLPASLLKRIFAVISLLLSGQMLLSVFHA